MKSIVILLVCVLHSVAYANTFKIEDFRGKTWVSNSGTKRMTLLLQNTGLWTLVEEGSGKVIAQGNSSEIKVYELNVPNIKSTIYQPMLVLGNWQTNEIIDASLDLVESHVYLIHIDEDGLSLHGQFCEGGGTCGVFYPIQE